MESDFVRKRAKIVVNSSHLKGSLSNQSVRADGMTAGGICLTASLWISKVVVLLVNASTNSADGVDMRGRWRISTEVPRKADMIWMARRSIDAELSCGTLRLSQP